ncbi:hypothetical protein [Sansalvadorimonas verongulae]|uniref:hypothetical protein n=1 Tax=Sansalvadorimonas verongulae TaxID=2172824 RepID=UPI0012BC8748|nr:hypothetical protein [Sansalvadorimonas verongulae]MTI13798.1 hypothetical protein [Sansalvadorimonas verongulae]
MSEPTHVVTTVVAGSTAVSVSAAKSLSVSESLLGSNIEQLLAGAFTIQLSDVTGILATVVLLVNLALNLYGRFKKAGDK